jgi:hypothetical protein
MSNMSYVRFENTLRDLQDVKAALEDMLVEPEGNELSHSEWAAMLRLENVAQDVQELIAQVKEAEDEAGGLHKEPGRGQDESAHYRGY